VRLAFIIELSARNNNTVVGGMTQVRKMLYYRRMRYQVMVNACTARCIHYIILVGIIYTHIYICANCAAGVKAIRKRLLLINRVKIRNNRLENDQSTFFSRISTFSKFVVVSVCYHYPYKAR